MKCLSGRSRCLAWCVVLAAVATGGSRVLAEPVPAEPVAAERQAPGKRLQFAVVTPCIDEPFFAEVMRGARDAAKLMDVDCDIWGTQSVDIAAQVAMVRKAITDGSDGIAVAIIDATAFDAVLAEAKERGIPVDQQPYMQGFYPIVQLAMAKRFGLTPTNMDAGAKIVRAKDVDAYLQREMSLTRDRDRQNR